MVQHPGNIDQIRAYLRDHHGEHNSLRVSTLYAFSFFTYYVTPEIPLAKPNPTLQDLLNPEWFVRVYWTIFLFTSLFAVILHWGTGGKTSFFLKFMFAQIALIILLFLYWSLRITGPMFTFNGYFFFSVQLLALLTFSALISGVVLPTLDRRSQVSLACAFVAPLLLVSGVGNTSDLGSQDVMPVVSSLKSKHVHKVMLSMPMQIGMLLPGAGIASYLKRSGIGFCFGHEWEFVFGRGQTCQDTYQWYSIALSPNSFFCRAPCSVLYSRPNLYVAGAPIPSVLELPAIVAANDNTHQSSGFNDSEGASVWSKKESFLRFYLSPEDGVPGPCLLRITGTTLPNRPVVVKVNGASVGVIDAAGRTTRTFTLDSNRLVWKGANTVAFYVPNAGPVGTDSRELGYMFEQLLVLRSPAKDRGLASPVVFVIPDNAAGTLISDMTWQPDGGWKTDGYYPDVGRLSEGVMWGSWNHNDALTGKLTSGAFSTGSPGCVVVPAAHGPSILNQRVAIVTGEGATVAEVPLTATDGKWQFYEIHYDNRVKTIRVAAEDRGTGFGQWVAVGQPRSCAGHL
jgi:hypothetical protein